MAEAAIDFDAEFSVLIARGADGQTKAFHPPRNEHRDGILRHSSVPAGDPIDALAKDAVTTAAALAEGESPLTPREHEVLAASREHTTIAQVAEALHLSHGTARNHLSSAMQKLGAGSRAEAIRMAEARGFL